MNPPFTIGCANPKCLTRIGTFDELPQPKSLTCPACGTQEMSICVFIEENYNLAENAKEETKVLQHPPGSKGKFITDMRQGDNYSVGRKKWMQKTRLIDKANNRYFEQVTDPDTGEVIHRTEHPLTDHTGHGSAKFEKPDTNDPNK